MASPICTVKDAAGPPQATTAAFATMTTGNTVTIAIADTAGVFTWAISCIGTDENSVAASVTASLAINPVAKTATFTAPAAGRSFIFRSTINAGVDTDAATRLTWTTTFKVATLTDAGNVVGALNETYEHSASFGYVAVINAAVRAAGAGSGAWKDSVRAATTAALPANTSAAGVLTAAVNGALTAQDGVTLVAADSLLVKNEAAGANNGIYRVTQVGTGALPYILTRRSDSDGIGDLLTGSRVGVSEGANYGQRKFRLDTTGVITIGTTAQAWALDIPARRAATTSVLHWPCSEGVQDATCGSTLNIGSGGTATMVLNGANHVQLGPDGSACGYGAAYVSSNAAAGANFSAASVIQPHASTPFASAIITPRQYQAGNSVITGLYTSAGTVFELGLTSAGLPYFTAKIAVVGSRTVTAAASHACLFHSTYHVIGYSQGSTLFVLVDGQEASAGGTAYAANNIDYAGTAPTYTIGNTQAALAATGFVGAFEEVRYGVFTNPATLYEASRETRRMRGQSRAV